MTVDLPGRPPSVAGENLRFADLVETQNLVVLRTGALHPWGSHRHSRNREACDLGFLLQQARYVRGRNVTLDQIPVDNRGVTRGKAFRYSECALDLGHLRSVLGVDTITVLDEMLDPALAAPAGGVLVDGDDRLL